MCREVRNERALARTAFARGEAQDVHGCAPNHLIAAKVRNFPDSSKKKVRLAWPLFLNCASLRRPPGAPRIEPETKLNQNGNARSSRGNTTSLSPGDFGDQLLEDGARKRLVILRGNDVGPRTPDHVALVILVELGFERENGEAVNADLGRDRLIAGQVDRSPSVVGTIT